MSLSSAGMPFVVSSGAGKVDPATRKLIRSHARKGRTQHGSRNRPSSQGNSRKPKVPRTVAEASGDRPVRAEQEDVLRLYAPQVPGRVGSDLSFVQLADGEIERSLLLNIVKISPSVSRIISPLMFAIGYHKEGNQERLHPFGRDPAALHITAFTVESFIDRVLHRNGTVNPKAMLHLGKGLGLLRERLSGHDDAAKASDETMGVVLKLATAAHFEGDHRSARRHLRGLRRMLDMRGGPGAFGGTPLAVETWRCDLAIAVLNGSDHLFFCRPSEPLPPYPEKLLPQGIAGAGAGAAGDAYVAQLVQGLDCQLATAWRVMRRFCLLVDLGADTQRLIRPRLIHETMVSVTYRLLRMRFAACSADEVVRQGLLAFAYHVFLQWQDIKFPYPYFSDAYKHTIVGFEENGGSDPGVSSRLMLWLLMVGAISVFDEGYETEEWLKDTLARHASRCGVRRWKEMEDVLKAFMWVALLDDHPGRRFYKRL